MILLRFIAVSLVMGHLAFGKTAPTFQGETLDGKKTSLKENLKPGRVLLLSFWATWCSPCLEELNHVTGALKKDPKMSLDVLAVNVDTSETSTDIKPTLKLYKFTDLTVIADPKHEIFRKYQDSKTLPYSVLISPTGEILTTFNGYHEGMMASIQKAITELGNKGTTVAPKS